MTKRLEVHVVDRKRVPGGRTSGPSKLRDDADSVKETTIDPTGQVKDGVEEFGDRAVNKVKSDHE